MIQDIRASKTVVFEPAELRGLFIEFRRVHSLLFQRF